MPEPVAAAIASSPDVPRSPKRIRHGTKRSNLVRSFLSRGDLGMNRFEAERIAHDHVLPSSVSQLMRDYGFKFEREAEQIPGFNGSSVETMRYRFTAHDRQLALELLAEAGD